MRIWQRLFTRCLRCPGTLPKSGAQALFTTDRCNRIIYCNFSYHAWKAGIFPHSGQIVSVTLLTAERFNRIYTTISPITPELYVLVFGDMKCADIFLEFNFYSRKFNRLLGCYRTYTTYIGGLLNITFSLNSYSTVTPKSNMNKLGWSVYCEGWVLFGCCSHVCLCTITFHLKDSEAAFHSQVLG